MQVSSENEGERAIKRSATSPGSASIPLMILDFAHEQLLSSTQSLNLMTSKIIVSMASNMPAHSLTLLTDRKVVEAFETAMRLLAVP